MEDDKRMRDLHALDKWRLDVRKYCGSNGDDKNGAFKIFVNGRAIFCIASNGRGWEHVSVSPKNQKRCPTWEEMCAVKNLFFEPEETVIQFHPAQSQYVDQHQYCLHLWRPIEQEIPTPTVELV